MTLGSCVPCTDMGNRLSAVPAETSLCSAGSSWPGHRAGQHVTVSDCGLINILILLPSPYISHKDNKRTCEDQRPPTHTHIHTHPRHRLREAVIGPQNSRQTWPCLSIKPGWTQSIDMSFPQRGTLAIIGACNQKTKGFPFTNHLIFKHVVFPVWKS